MNHRYTFTIFTPTYNRAHTLHRVYNSLVSQTFTDFEWIVVDDGSTDNTTEVLAVWEREAPFPMRVLRQENLGKGTASNRAVELAQGEFFVTIDSDDACLPNALETLINHWRNIPEERREDYCGVTCPCQDTQGNMIGGPYPQDVMDGCALDMYYRLGLLSERWGFRRTDLMRRFPFPELSGLRYVTPSLMRDRMDRRYLHRFINEPLLIYHLNPAEASAKRIRTIRDNPMGLALWHEEKLSNDLRWFRYAPKRFLSYAVHYGRFSLHSGRKFSIQWKSLSGLRARLLYLMCLPTAILVWRLDICWLRRNAPK